MAEAIVATPDSHALRRGDRLLLLAFCLVLFGYSMVGGRPLTMHEAVLPQSAREMLADGDWIVPKSGGRPWLERPPLPQWVTVAVCAPLGGCDREWVVRLPANLMGAAVVLIVAGLAARWFGRSIGLVSGVVLATMFEFVSYAWLAEADIYLCLLVTATIARFALSDSTSRARESPGSDRFFGTRSWPVIIFFVLLGATNLAKGLLFGTGMALIPVLGYLAWNLALTRDWTAIRRYAWFWGWMLSLVIGLAWPVAAYRRYPDVLDLWLFDHLGRLDGSYTAITEPFWYYLAMLPGALAPWTLFSTAGLMVCVRDLTRAPSEPLKFLVCWAVLPIVMFSLPSGKHHHYLLQCLAPWAVLGAIGLRWCWRRLSAPAQQHARLAMSGVLAAIVAVYLLLHSLFLPQRDQCLEDTAFLKTIPSLRDPSLLLVANGDLQSMDLFRNLFYLDSDAISIHTLDYLDDTRFSVPQLLVLTRARDRARLEDFGDVTLLLQSERSRRESGPEDRMSLFHLRYRHDLVRRQHPARISPMQAMYRY